jgi:hypothetical protein
MYTKELCVPPSPQKFGSKLKRLELASEKSHEGWQQIIAFNDERLSGTLRIDAKKKSVG